MICQLFHTMRIRFPQDNFSEQQYHLRAITTSRILFGESMGSLERDAVGVGVAPMEVDFNLLDLSRELRYPGFICNASHQQPAQSDPALARECRAQVVDPQQINVVALK